MVVFWIASFTPPDRLLPTRFGLDYNPDLGEPQKKITQSAELSYYFDHAFRHLRIQLLHHTGGDEHVFPALR